VTINCISEHGQRMLQAVLGLLTVKARTREELQVALGVSKPTARRYLELLRTEPRRVFICRWQHTTGNLAPVYAPGNKADKKRPKRPTAYQYYQIRWKRIKADPTKHAQVLHQHRLDAARRRLKANPNTWLSALIIAPVGAIPRTPPTRRRAEHAEQ
jgi:hypothetical protein